MNDGEKITTKQVNEEGAFVLYSDIPELNPWGNRVNPHAYLFRRYGVLPYVVKDNRDYTDEMLVHLGKVGAVMVESETSMDTVRRNSHDETVYDAIEWDDGSAPSSGAHQHYLFWYKGIIIVIDGKPGAWRPDFYHLPASASVKEVIEELKPFLRVIEKGSVSVLYETNGNLYTKKVDFKAPVIDDLDLNYGDGFKEKNDHILEKLSRNSAGVMLFSGDPGTGKSFYIKWLTSRVDREFIFIPIGMASQLASPSFISVLMDHPKAVLVLEDAEQALQSREVDFHNSSTVSTLLNLGDGVLGSLLDICILATYNCERQLIDKALLRKGRLLFSYQFDKLSVPAAQRLANHLHRDITVSEPTILADIYNASEDTNYQPPKKVALGFNFAAASTPK